MRLIVLLTAVALATGLWLSGNAPARAVGLCNGLSTTPVAFGNYDVFNLSDLQSTGTISYTCTSVVTPVTVEISAGNSGSCTARFLAQGANHLNYNLYLDAAHTQVWGTATPPCGSISSSNPPLNTQVTQTVYGLIQHGQDVFYSASPYTDSLTVTLTF